MVDPFAITTPATLMRRFRAMTQLLKVRLDPTEVMVSYSGEGRINAGSASDDIGTSHERISVIGIMVTLVSTIFPKFSAMRRRSTW